MKAVRLSVLLMMCCAIIPLSGQPAPVTVTHGPILGRLGPTEIGVWVRTSRPGTFRVRYGLDPATPRRAVGAGHDGRSTTTTPAGCSCRA